MAKLANTNVAPATEQAANDAGFAVVVDREMDHPLTVGIQTKAGLSADGTGSVLRGEHGFVLIDGDPVFRSQLSVLDLAGIGAMPFSCGGAAGLKVNGIVSVFLAIAPRVVAMFFGVFGVGQFGSGGFAGAISVVISRLSAAFFAPSLIAERLRCVAKEQGQRLCLAANGASALGRFIHGGHDMTSDQELQIVR